MKLTDILHRIGDRVYLASRVTALTGGVRAVDGVVITNGGDSYNSAPAVGFTSGGGSGAAGTAVIAGSKVVSVTMTNNGSGYTGTPSVGFTSGGGTGAAGTAIMLATSLDAITTVGLALTPLVVVGIVISNQMNFYQLRTGTDAESSPNIIRPDDYAGTTNEKVWELIGVFVGGSKLAEGANIQLGTSTGTKIGTATSQKLGLFNVTPVIQPAAAAQAAVTLGNVNGAIGGLTVSVAYSQAEVQALRDATETLADDVRAMADLLHALRTAGVNLGTIKGAA